MSTPRIFLGSPNEQVKPLEAIARGLSEIADAEPWTTTFNAGHSTTTTGLSQSGPTSPRDNVVFEAGLFGGALDRQEVPLQNPAVLGLETAGVVDAIGADLSGSVVSRNRS